MPALEIVEKKKNKLFIDYNRLQLHAKTNKNPKQKEKLKSNNTIKHIKSMQLNIAVIVWWQYRIEFADQIFIFEQHSAEIYICMYNIKKEKKKKIEMIFDRILIEVF